MKKYLIDILFGLMLIVLTLAVQFIVTMPFDEIADSQDPERWKQLINRELLLAALPMLLITFFLAKPRRTLTLSEGALRGGVWGLCILVFYVAIGNLNGSVGMIFTSLGLYILVACVVAGPMLQGLLAQRKKAA